jgi:hypothetical protein
VASRALLNQLQQHDDSSSSSSLEDSDAASEESLASEDADVLMEDEDEAGGPGTHGSFVEAEDIVEELLHSYFPDFDPGSTVPVDAETSINHRWSKIVAEARQPLYEGASCSRLSYILLLSNLAVQYNVPGVFMHNLYGLLSRKNLPPNNAAPTTWQEAKSVLTTIGMEYRSIHACPNDCVLYRGRYSRKTRCPSCKAKRYRQDTIGDKIPVKVPQFAPRMLWSANYSIGDSVVCVSIVT